VQCAIQSLKDFLIETDLHLHNIDLVIPSQSPKGFIPKLKERIGLADRFVEVDSNGGELHTAGPAFALEKVWHDGRFNQAKNIIFLCVGSGITTAIALYKNNSRR